MRTFEGGGGARWDVVAGRESWGALVAIFIPRSRGGAEEEREIRQAALQATSYEEAEAELESLDENGLRDLLERSLVKRR